MASLIAFGREAIKQGGLTHVWMGRNFLVVPIWRPRRKILAPTFSSRNMNNFVNIFTKQSRVLVDQLKETAEKGSFPIWNYLASYSMDSVCGYQYAMMSMKTAVASLLRQYRLLPATNCTKANRDLDLRLTYDIMMKDFDQFTVQLESRRQT